MKQHFSELCCVQVPVLTTVEETFEEELLELRGAAAELEEELRQLQAEVSCAQL